MSQLAPPLPPVERDFEIFRLIRVEQQSTRAVATAFNVSQTRLCQIVERVTQFLLEITPSDKAEERLPQRLHLARSIAAERVDFLFGKATESFHASQGKQTIVRHVAVERGPPVTVTTIRDSAGDPRYLVSAAKLALLGSKLPVAVGLSAVPSALAAESSTEPTASPPDRDCSQVAATSPKSASLSAQDQPVTKAPNKSYAAKSPIVHEADNAVTSPVQTPVSATAFG